MKPSALITFVVAALMCGCVNLGNVSIDPDYNYSLVFPEMRQPKPMVLNSRLERYTKDVGLWKTEARNGEWEFEILAPRAWVDEVKIGFIPTAFSDTFRRPTVLWWKPTEEKFDAFRMPGSSFPAAHLYVEKHPKDESRIHVFIQRS